MLEFWWIPIVAIVLVGAIYFWYPRRRAAKTVLRLVQAKRRFHMQRERLEAKFVQLAAAHSKTNAPRWADCMFADDVAYVRNRTTGELSAFVAVTVSTDEPSASSQETADTVANLQAGTAVFRFDCDHWETDGRAILNLSPSEAVRHYGSDFEMIGEELAHPA
jgi:hypothetical protein